MAGPCIGPVGWEVGLGAVAPEKLSNVLAGFKSCSQKRKKVKPEAEGKSESRCRGQADMAERHCKVSSWSIIKLICVSDRTHLNVLDAYRSLL